MSMQPVFEVGLLAFDGERSAERVLEAFRKRGAIGRLVPEFAVLEHHPSGKFSVHDYTAEATRGSRTGLGAAAGGLVGMLFGPVGILAGVVGGGLVGHSMGGSNPKEVGISDEFLGTIEDALPPGSSALLVIGEGEAVGQMIGEVRSSDVIVRTEVRRPLSESQTKQVREAFAKRKGSA
jgi:uncharacterized membrane protein